MFTKEDYHGYFELIEEKEKAMVFFLRKCMSSIEDKSVVSPLKEVMGDEVNHFKLSKKLFELLEQDLQDRRVSKRESMLDEVKIKDLSGGLEIIGTYADLSAQGMEIQVDKKFPVDTKLELWFAPEGSSRKMHRFGTVVWTKIVHTSSSPKYNAGIKFVEEKDN